LGYPGHTNDIPLVIDEVEKIHSILANGTLLLREHATAETLREVVPNAGILHIATHGKMEGNNSFLSFLELAPDSNSDGYLRVFDLAQLSLWQTDLVCLSGCETGQTLAKGGELLGLQSSVFQAGATSLLANIWNVEDRASAQLLPDFYRRYMTGKSKAEALRQAQIALRQRGEQANDILEGQFAHPYSFAPFAFFGVG
jgi:CHAT domain-containing protein